MAVQVSYPGVYIDEFQPAAPIQGVSTSVAAFLGANPYGPPNKPTLITSWDEYRQKFALPAPTPPEDDDFLWYAVRGFFENGGQICYVTAISNALPDHFDLRDGNTTGPKPTVSISARRSGVLNPPLQVKSVSANVVTTANIYAVEALLTSDVAKGEKLIPVDEPERFLAGDSLIIFITGTGAKSEPVTVDYTDAAGVHITAPLANAYTTAKNSALKFSEFAVGANSFRVNGPTTAVGPKNLVVGSIVTLTQQPAGGGGQPHKQSTVVTAVRAERITAALTTYRVMVRDALTGFTLDAARLISLKSEEFSLTLTEDPNGPVVGEYLNLSMSATHPRYYAKIINEDANGLIRAEPYIATNGAPSNTPLPDNRPLQTTFTPLVGGVPHSTVALTAGSEYVSALKALEPIKDISIVAIPDRTDATVQGALLRHCNDLFVYDRVAIFDPELNADLASIQTQLSSLQDTKGFGALYYPRIALTSVKTGSSILVPPSGHIAGIYARTDLKRGVYKAPAGADATIYGALGLERVLSDSEQGILNPKGINVIRIFQTGGRPRVWGARTTSTDTNWQYVNIRRLFIFLEKSIQQSIRGAVFEPNNLELWQKLKRTLTAFLTQQWRDGALFGETERDAFYVRIDEALNPPSERALGRLYIEIGVKPTYPAEFIIVRIGIWQGGSTITE